MAKQISEIISEEFLCLCVHLDVHKILCVFMYEYIYQDAYYSAFEYLSLVVFAHKVFLEDKFLVLYIIYTSFSHVAVWEISLVGGNFHALNY